MVGLRALAWRTLLLVLALAAGQASTSDGGPLLPETITEEIVAAFLAEHGISTVEEFIAALPPLHTSHYIAVHGSTSPTADFISGEHPRIVSWGADSRFIVTWTTNPASPDADQVEFLEPVPEEGRWTAGVIDFSGAAPEISHPASCSGCHSTLNRPAWGLGDWHGDRGTEDDGSDEAAILFDTMPGTTNPRLVPLDLEGYDNGINRSLRLPNGRPMSPNWELADTLVLRHAQVLFQRLRNSEDYDLFVKSAMCKEAPDFLEDIGKRFEWQHANISRLSSSGELVQADLAVPDLLGDYRAGGSSVRRAIAFLIYHDALLRFDHVRSQYRETSNEDMLDYELTSVVTEMSLLYPPGSATAEEEFLAAHREFFALGGQSLLDARVLRQSLPKYNTTLMNAHVWAFRSRVCTALTQDGGYADPPPEQPPNPDPPPPPPDPDPPPPPPPPPPTRIRHRHRLTRIRHRHRLTRIRHRRRQTRIRHRRRQTRIRHRRRQTRIRHRRRQTRIRHRRRQTRIRHRRRHRRSWPASRPRRRWRQACRRRSTAAVRRGRRATVGTSATAP